MADGVCADGTADCVKDPVLKQTLDLLSISHKDCLNSDTVKSSFYIHGDSGDLCEIDGVVGLGVRASSVLCGNNGDNCRKKRCADRYDSSESSDSGVATLSCTDCSTSTSDITDPGSPFSTASTHSSSSDDCKHDMAPQEPCWPWGGKERNKGPPPPPPPLAAVTATPLTSVTANVIANLPLKRQTAITSHKTATKRLKVDHNHCVRVTSPQQGKITEYFKAQVKPTKSSSKESALNKYFPTVLSGTKAKATEAKRDGSPSWTKSSIDGKPSKPSQKVAADKKTGAAVALVTARKVSSSATSKFLESKRNGSNVPMSPKLSVLPSSPAAIQKSPSLSLAESSPKPGATAPAAGTPKLLTSSDGKEAITKPKTIVSESERAASPVPILSTPTTIRFPAVVSDSSCSSSSLVHPKPSSSHSESPDSIVCRWSECNVHFDTNTGLLEHLQAKHVNPQVMCENYVCLWVGCKVYARTSCSRSWLERHVLSHGGNKPFRCIVDGCGQLFSSQTTLERHVNGHFNQTEAGTGTAGARRSLESASSKLFRRNGKKLRYRRQPWSARMFDYFDAGIMEGLQHRLVSMTEVRTQGNVATAAGDTVSLNSKVLARRVLPGGRIQVLLRWYPPDILPDEWVAETEARSSCSVPIPSLSAAAMTTLQATLFVPGRNKQRRKPVKST